MVHDKGFFVYRGESVSITCEDKYYLVIGCEQSVI